MEQAANKAAGSVINGATGAVEGSVEQAAGAASEKAAESGVGARVIEAVGNSGPQGMIVAGTAASALDKEVTDNLDGSNRLPEPAASSTGNGAGGNDELTGSFGKSNLGNLFGGGQPYVPPVEQQSNVNEKQKDGGDSLPPPN